MSAIDIRPHRALCEIRIKLNETEVAVSEILHVTEINRMSKMLCDYIESKNLDKMAVLIDGLDGNWRLGENHEIMSEILLAMIGASRDVWREYEKSIKSKHYWKGTSIAIFVRSDVFATTLERARDPDKLQFESLNWPDVDFLINLVARRIIASSDRFQETFNWEEILEPGFSYDEMKTILRNNIIPRPRDYICYFQRVLFHSNSRRTKYLTKRDFQSAKEGYSQWVLLSVSAESQPYIPNMLDLLLEFDQKKAILSMAEIDNTLIKAGINGKDLGRTINFLVDVNFLGYGIDANNYRFPASPWDEIIMKRRFMRHIKGDYNLATFKIHNAFSEVLNLQ